MNISLHPIINDENGLPFIIHGIGSQSNQCQIIRKEGYPLHQFIFSTTGKGIIIFNNEEYEVHENMIIYLKPHEPHEYYRSTDTWGTNWIIFSGENIQDILDKFNFSTSKIIESNNPIIKTLFNELMITLKSKDLFQCFLASSIFYRLLVELFRISCVDKENKYKKSDYIIKLVLAFIEDNYNKDISLDDISGHVNISKHYLCKIFKQELSMRPFEYIAKKRIQESKKLLLNTSLPIRDICKMIGYKDCSYFCANFRKLESISPSEFRGNL